MNSRLLIALAVLAGGGVVAFLAFYQPDARKTEAVKTKIVVEEGAAARDGGPAAARVKPKAVEPPPEAPPSADDPADAEVEADAEPKGPFEVSLGKHTIYLTDPDGGRVAQMRVILTVPDVSTRKEVLARKRHFVRMLYFLGSKRRADGAIGQAGQRRFEADLLERLNNAMKGGKVVDVRFDNYRITDPPPYEKKEIRFPGQGAPPAP